MDTLQVCVYFRVHIARERQKFPDSAILWVKGLYLVSGDFIELKFLFEQSRNNMSICETVSVQ